MSVCGPLDYSVLSEAGQKPRCCCLRGYNVQTHDAHGAVLEAQRVRERESFTCRIAIMRFCHGMDVYM